MTPISSFTSTASAGLLMYVLASLVATANSGNYLECSENFCEEGGNCLVMSGSPSPFDATQDEDALASTSAGSRSSSSSSASREFEASPLQLNWRQAEQFCQSRRGRLVRPSDRDALSRAQEFIVVTLGGRRSNASFWVDDGGGGSCQVIKGDSLAVSRWPCRKAQGMYALCQADQRDEGGDEGRYDYRLGHSKSDPGLHPMFGRRQHSSVAPRQEDSSDTGLPYYYTCQCPQGYGYENCTLPTDPGGDDDADGNAGTTFCQTNEVTRISAPTIVEEDVIFVDHAAYGRPFRGFYSASSPCSREGVDFALRDEDYCVAAGSLKAVTYWCQGKKQCSFPNRWIVDMGEQKDFFVVERETRSAYLAGVRCMMEGGSLALPKGGRHWELVQAEMDRKQNLGADGYWMNPKLANLNLPGNIFWEDEDSEYRDQCVVLSQEGEVGLLLRWVPCYSQVEEASYYPMCDTSFGFDPSLSSSGHRSSAAAVDQPEDLTCMDALSQPTFEYRFHVEELGRLEVACPMSVDYMRSNTCYKLTEPLTWREARRQCWRWGGELAFPLRAESPQCSTRIYTGIEEEVWMASNTSCPTAGGVDGPQFSSSTTAATASTTQFEFDDSYIDDTSRCVVSFADTDAFMEGAYFTTNDLCFPFPRAIDPDPDAQRRGICALPPVKTPRTLLPGYATCPPVEADDPRWPYEADVLVWNVTGVAGETSYLECPEGQSGYVSWACGSDGEWVGEPDTSQCTSIDVDGALDELEEDDSVPADVVSDVYDDVVAQGDDLTAGDVLGVIDVVDRAVEVQLERLESLPPEEQEEYADDFSTETINLLDDILAKPEPWQDIEIGEKTARLSDIQTDVDDVATSVLQYTTYDTREYLSVNEVIKLQVNREEDLSGAGSSYQDGRSSITVTTGQRVGGISFLAYNTVGCILAEKADCSNDFPDGSEGVVNSVVLGATLYDDNGAAILSSSSSPLLGSRQLQQDDINVDLTFYYDFAGSEYDLTNVTCAFWDVDADDWSTAGCELVSSDGASAQCRCDHLTNFGVLLDVNGNLEGNELLEDILTVITIVGCTLSIVCLLACLYVFTFVKGLRGERTTIHRNLCLSLLLAEVLLLSGLDATGNSAVCGVIAGFLHFFFLAAFAWMFVEGLHVYYMLVKVFDSAQSPMWRYYAVGYGVPAAIVVVSVVVVEATGTHGYGTEEACWLDYENGLIWAFAAPVLLVIVVNSVMFVQALLIARSSISKKNINNRGSIKKREQDTKTTMTLVKGSFSLLCILGLTWVFGFVYFFDGGEWLSIVFTILNSLQGVFILLFHVLLNEKARKEVQKSLRRTFRRAKAFTFREPYVSSSGGTGGSPNKFSSDGDGKGRSSSGAANGHTRNTLSTNLSRTALSSDSGMPASGPVSLSEETSPPSYVSESMVTSSAPTAEANPSEEVRVEMEDVEVRYVRGGGTITVVESRPKSPEVRLENFEMAQVPEMVEEEEGQDADDESSMPDSLAEKSPPLSSSSSSSSSSCGESEEEIANVAREIASDPLPAEEASSSSSSSSSSDDDDDGGGGEESGPVFMRRADSVYRQDTIKRTPNRVAAASSEQSEDVGRDDEDRKTR